MKKILTFLFFLSLFSSNISFSQSGWFWQNPLPQGNDLYSVKFVNENTAFACGYSGVIMKTTNKGINWNILRTDSGYINTSIFFHNVNTGWVTSAGDLYGPAGYTSWVLKTTDSGNNWIEKYSFYRSYLQSIEFTSIDTGYMLSIGSDIGLMYKTINAGNNWTQIYSNPYHYPSKSFFINNTTGYVCGTFGIIKTSNGGINWVTQLDGTSYPDIDVFSIFFTNPTTGYSSGSLWAYPNTHYVVYKTTNSGINWVSQDIEGIGQICFLNSSTGFICGGKLLKTTNSGVNWNNIILPETVYGNAIDIKSTNGIIAGDRGIILNSVNAGENWSNYYQCEREGYSVSCVRFFNKNIGYATSGNKILKKTNGGNNWYIVLNQTQQSISYLSVVNSNVVFACGGGGLILKTTNSGTNWNLQNSGITSGLVSMSFVNDLTGYCMSSGNVLKTSNGGSNWINISSVGGFSICFVNINTGYLSGYTYSYKTTNGGNSWFSIPTDGQQIFFLNPDTGFTVAIGMKIRKTTDGGMNWVVQTQAPHSWRFYGIHFLNSNFGFAVGNFGAIARTTNGGINWIYQLSPTNNNLYSVYMTDSNECYASGYHSVIIKTTNGGWPIGIHPISTEIPSSFSLSQNYPNPFNPVTRIKYDIPANVKSEKSNVKIIVYDILGREIETLVNESQKPGSYEVTWDGSRYASGVYFYRLITDEYVETKKMVLIK